jgi:hypothetical protein
MSALPLNRNDGAAGGRREAIGENGQPDGFFLLSHLNVYRRIRV